MDFNLFNDVIEKEKVEVVNKQYGYNYVLMTVINGLPIHQIDFEAFLEDDVIDVYQSLEESITDEDQNGELMFDPNHPYSRIRALSYKFVAMERTEKVRPPSPFAFL